MDDAIRYTEYMRHFEAQNRGGGIIYITSNLAPLVYKETAAGGKFDTAVFIKSIKDAFNKDNTVIIPTFNFDFCKGATFDYKKSPSQVGILGDYALKDTDFKRTKHPIYSFAIYGKDQEILTSLDYKDAFGDESVFSYMYHGNAFQIGIGINTYTANHFVEEHFFSDTINYRFVKNFSAGYIDENGNQSHREYSMFVRNLELNTVINTAPFKKCLTDAGIVKVTYMNEIPFYETYVKNYCDYAKEDIANNKSRKLVTYDGQND